MKHPRILKIVLIAVILVLEAAYPLAAQAALGITSVQPNSVDNSQSTELIITGTDFVDGAVVLLESFGALDTHFVNAQVLTATLPAGLAPGRYDITAVNPDSASATLQDALMVTLAAVTDIPATATATQQPEDTLVPSERPLVIVESYNAGSDSVSPNQEFELAIRLKNIGATPASNLVAIFPPGDFVPRVSGGVLAVTELDPGEKKKFSQPLTATYEILGKTAANAVMQISYTDPNGVLFSETFNMTIPVTAGRFVPTATTTPTPTAPPIPRPQLVIPSYTSDSSPLQPGKIFTLEISVENKGNANARRVSMILGGGGDSDGSPPSGTPDTSGGVSGGGGDFGTFAPVSSSNVQFLGDLDAGDSMSAHASLIVNANTTPGAYPMLVSFNYVDEKGLVYTDDQVITLLVYQLPQVEVNFYRPPDPFFAGQQAALPVQVVNLGRKSVVLGTMEVSGSGAEYSNNTILVGALDVGGYFTLDAFAVPDQPGPLEVMVKIGYTDDFNESQVITRTLSVEVQEMIFPEEPIPGEGMPGGNGGFPTDVQPETFWQKVLRMIKGLFGLDSAPQQVPGELLPGEVPPMENPASAPVPVKPKG